MRSCPECRRVWKEANEFCPADGKALVLVTREADPLVGTVLDDRYRLENLLGTGGMGFVYESEQIGLGRRVAIKMLYAERTRDPQSVRRFRREARALAALDHPGIVRVLEYGEGNGHTPYIVMEKVQGAPLDQTIRTHGRLSPRHAVHVTAQIASALAVAHARGVVHRDLKPANVNVDLVDGQLSARILDFGLALLAKGPLDEPGSHQMRLTRAGVIFGTPEYMAPEQVKGQEATARSDLYALGILLYELLSGLPPFVGGNPSAVIAMHIEKKPPPLRARNLPQPAAQVLDALIQELLAKNPDQRPADAAAVEARLLAIEPLLPDPGPLTSLAGATAAALAGMSHDSTLEASVPPGAQSQPQRGADVSNPPWLGLGGSPDADRDLAAALSAARRTRRARLVVAAVVLGGIGAAAIPVAIRAAREPDPAPMPAAIPIALEAIPGGANAPALVNADHPVAEHRPGGDAQQQYENARRDLERELAARGLRPRDLRAHPEAGRVWEQQDLAARGLDFENAVARIEALRAIAARARTADIMRMRLDHIEARIGQAATPEQVALFRALRETLDESSRTREDTRRFVTRLDELSTVEER